ncbi:signal peptidase I [Nitrospirillum viridazoti]|uniref:Signal peptidase I n=1 Tax=Nitrospirillum amazonense TaxID=28077 RepID=A0A560HV06_9PROT|nr:signal peptidase I [Nitrospirillum amazonense]TWB48830.1 signal peptidase I [Nitrospirillum amazonense]
MRRAVLEWGRFILIWGVCVLSFRAFAFGSYYVPSESMLPTLAVGDHFIAAKYAYGYSRHSPDITLPEGFIPTADGRLLSHLPQRGDIVVLKPEGAPEALVKRVIGLPGDTVQLAHGRLVLNGQMIGRHETGAYDYRDDHGRTVHVTEYVEDLPATDGSLARHAVLQRSDEGPADNTGVYTVPAGHVFLMGDNRDNSQDSRFPYPDLGFVPLDRVIARAQFTAYTNHFCKAESDLTCPGGDWSTRFGRSLKP